MEPQGIPHGGRGGRSRPNGRSQNANARRRWETNFGNRRQATSRKSLSRAEEQSNIRLRSSVAIESRRQLAHHSREDRRVLQRRSARHD